VWAAQFSKRWGFTKQPPLEGWKRAYAERAEAVLRLAFADPRASVDQYLDPHDYRCQQLCQTAALSLDRTGRFVAGASAGCTPFALDVRPPSP
jgi:hypothetical protein